MKVIFAGPSLSGVVKNAPGCRFMAPAAQGDITRAIIDGATVIGLIDGVYETVAAVWHKEILFALQRGVRVLGAASMGALRAAECGPFGMEPIGEIARRYVSGELDDDAAVAVVHAPRELDYLPLNEALVDAEATIARLYKLDLLGPNEAAAMLDVAGAIFFKQRTVEQMVGEAITDAARRSAILRVYADNRVRLKRQDAMQLVSVVSAASAGAPARPRDWILAEPASWRDALNELDPTSALSRPPAPFDAADDGSPVPANDFAADLRRA